VRLLLDTHYLYWLVEAESRLTIAETAVLSDPEHELIVSPVSILEIRLKWQMFDRDGARKGTVDPVHALAYVADNAITLAELSGEDCATSLDVPLTHRDPFDEQLLIHAQRLGTKLLTRDRALIDHPLAWRPAA
jgi:PIN domain nuclease of toxin-antitoxin system